jgi:hypothetical protein
LASSGVRHNDLEEFSLASPVANLATCSRWMENAYAIQLRRKKVDPTKL